MLKERQREIERDQRLELAGKKNKRGRDEDRDVSERIALGQAAQPTSAEALFDQRLFNQSAGMAPWQPRSEIDLKPLVD